MFLITVLWLTPGDFILRQYSDMHLDLEFHRVYLLSLVLLRTNSTRFHSTNCLSWTAWLPNLPSNIPRNKIPYHEGHCSRLFPGTVCMDESVSNSPNSPKRDIKPKCEIWPCGAHKKNYPYFTSVTKHTGSSKGTIIPCPEEDPNLLYTQHDNCNPNPCRSSPLDQFSWVHSSVWVLMRVEVDMLRDITLPV